MISIIAHRGYSSRYRENSPEAWQRAVEAGADFIEMDVRFTADLQGVCLHDADLWRLAGRAERIADLPYAQVAGIEVNGEPAAPRLLDALRAISPSTGIMLDVKDERAEALAALDALIREARDHHFVLGLHTLDGVVAMRARGHGSMLALTPTPEQGAAFIKAGCSMLRLWETDITPERLAEAARLQVPVWITVGGRGTDRTTGDIDTKGLVAVAAMGISGVIVNDPATARADLQ
jgi:glycerophosphoryl diester phosphodiesterase